MENQHLLMTKLTIPHHYERSIIARPDIFARLDAGLHFSLLLLSAPAGFGKTTLLSSWLRERQYATAWVALEHADNDLHRFWSYLLAALQTCQPTLASLLHQWQHDAIHDLPASLHTMLTSLINLVCEHTETCLLVLDDYHTISTPSIHQSMAFFLEHLPPHLHVLLSSRCDPPLPLAKLRVQGRLFELHTNDLRFCSQDSQRFLEKTMGLTLPENAYQELFTRTEGWIAGLRLAALALQNKDTRAHIDSFIHSFNGTNRYIMTYLNDEVLAQQTPEIQTFLLQTSILERLHSSLCAAVTDQPDAGQLLEYLEKQNLFLTMLDSQQQWYRYDRLFSELLYARLQQLSPSQVPELHLRASRWFTAHDLHAGAIHHALAGGEMTLAAHLLEQHAPDFMQQGSELLVHTWLKRLPDQIRQSRPLLAFLYASTLLVQGQISEYEQFLQRAERHWRDEHNELMLTQVALLRATASLLQGKGLQVQDYARQALELVPNTALTLRGEALVNLGAGHLLQGEIDEAQTLIHEGYRLTQKRLHDMPPSVALLYMGDVQLQQGQLRAALQTWQRLLNKEHVLPTWLTIATHLRIGQVYQEWNDMLSARIHAEQSFRLVQAGEMAPAHYYLLLAQLACQNNDTAEALSLLEQADESNGMTGANPLTTVQIIEVRTRLLLTRGAKHTSPHLLPHDHLFALDTSPLEGELWSRVQARLLIAQDRPEQGQQLLEQTYRLAQAQGRIDSQLHLLVLLVLAYHAQSNTQKTMHTLEECLALAEAGGYTWLFVAEGEIMAALLTELYSRYQRKTAGDTQHLTSGYIYTLLSAFGEDATPIWLITQEQDNMLIDRLSEREYTVLALIAEGLSNQEIAQKLVVTISTVKTHLNNIYAKLHVHTRLQAVTKAHTLGLIRRSEVDTEPLAHPRASENL